MNWNIIIPIFILIGDIFLAWFCYWLGYHKVQPIEDTNELIQQENAKLKQEQDILWHKIDELNYENTKLEQNIAVKEQKKILLDAELKSKQKEKDSIQEYIDQSERLAEQRANAIYERQISENEQRFELIAKDYMTAADDLYKQKEKLEKELESLKDTKAAAIAAAKREKEIQDNKNDYCLTLPIEYNNDVKILRGIIKKITKPRSILMAIWQAYYQPIAKKKFPEILGKTDVCGIYKITNQETGECYIGQAVDIRRRWMDHCKAGLGIDTPPGNQLYAAMLEYGLDVFSFELLLECKSDQLNENEKYFIKLYNSDAIGYNISKGVN